MQLFWVNDFKIQTWMWSSPSDFIEVSLDGSILKKTLRVFWNFV